MKINLNIEDPITITDQEIIVQVRDRIKQNFITKNEVPKSEVEKMYEIYLKQK